MSYGQLLLLLFILCVLAPPTIYLSTKMAVYGYLNAHRLFRKTYADTKEVNSHESS